MHTLYLNYTLIFKYVYDQMQFNYYYLINKKFLSYIITTIYIITITLYNYLFMFILIRSIF